MPLTTSSATCPQTSIASSSTIIGLKTPPAPLRSSSPHHSSDHILSLMALMDDLSELLPHLPAGIRISNALFRKAEEYGCTRGLSRTRSVGPGCGMFRALQPFEASGSGGVLASHASAGQRRLSAREVEPGGRAVYPSRSGFRQQVAMNW
jgi:hypothetical protein